ncbi:circadian clock KaiB family protein [Flaviaesturariibacter amylovorans]|uniref:Circadian clock KaiB family protein n=1 Tax=Flaviaesturariibacter amylovorans TaxID=1084520 RepID=A0ABP8GFB6_9BACT
MKAQDPVPQDPEAEAEYVLRLFITGATPNSLRAVSNIREICDRYLAGRYSLKIIDVSQEGTLVQEEQIIALPLLVKKSPGPERKLIGDLSQTEKVLKALGLNP